VLEGHQGYITKTVSIMVRVILRTNLIADPSKPQRYLLTQFCRRNRIGRFDAHSHCIGESCKIVEPFFG
jgi:hypothetical protein